MLKTIGLLALLCIGGAVAFAFYAAYRITKLGQAMGRGGSIPHSDNGYISTTGTTIIDDSSHHSGSASSLEAGFSSGESIGSTIGESIGDFGSSSDSGGGDSGGGDSGGGDSGGSSD